MNQLALKDFLIVGGLSNLNEKNIELRSLQIKNGLMIHTCNDYDNSLEVIKEAAYGLEENLKIIMRIRI